MTTNFLDGKIIHIEMLYEGCLFTLYPSFYEGRGLLVTDSLAFGRSKDTNRSCIRWDGGVADKFRGIQV